VILLGAVVWGNLADHAWLKHPRRKQYLVAGARLLTLALLSFAFGALPPGPLNSR